MRSPTITPTDKPEQFLLTVPHYDFERSRNVESDVIALVNITNTGVTIGYSHHIIRQRPANSGPPEQESMVRMTLSPGVSAILRQGFESAYFDMLRVKIEELPDA